LGAVLGGVGGLSAATLTLANRARTRDALRSLRMLVLRETGGKEAIGRAPGQWLFPTCFAEDEHA